MKVSIWFVVLVGYIAYLFGELSQAVGTPHPSYTLQWDAPFIAVGYFILLAWIGYMAGKDQTNG